MQCPSCGSIYYVKNGKIRGNQRYKCYDCGCTYTKGMWNGRSEKDKRNALELYLNGKSSREIKKEIGIPDTTVLSWIRLLIKNISEIEQIKKEFDLRYDEKNKLTYLNDQIKKKKLIPPLSVNNLKTLKDKHLDAMLFLMRHRPKKRKRPKSAPTERCAKIVRFSDIKEGFSISPVVKIGKRKVKRHNRMCF